MRLAEVRTLLVTTPSSDWHHIEHDGPTFRDDVGPLVDGDPVRSHDNVAVYEDDVRLTLAWGLEPPGENPHEPDAALWWPKHQAGWDLRSFLVDVFYCGNLIDRHVGARVNKEACLPYPDAHTFTDVPKYGEPIAWSVTQWQVDLFRLIHHMERGGRDYDRYVERAEFTVDTSGDT